ncbi:MAG TPA: class I SAM-dependent methyltransferase [Planctomycetota bacterium]|jgi:SAM-dependent methyltransferase|nr:class I SAM-dependent methyltransferase [Planctomycetota bacterium]
MPYGPRGIYRLIPSLTWQCDEQVSRVLSRVGAGARIADLGAGGRKITPATICLDFTPGGGTDVVGDVQRLPFRDGSLDLVFATGLLEHVEDERRVIAEIARVLRKGGLVHVEVPFLEQYHEDPIDCRRLTVDGLDRGMRAAGFRTLQRGAHIGPTVTLLNTSARWWALWFSGTSRFSRALSFACFAGLSILFWPLRFLDRFLMRKPGAEGLAMGVYFTGEKA